MTGTGVDVLSTGTVVPYLRGRGLLTGTAQPTVTRLAGGVSGEVIAVDAGPTHLVVKQALARLRVEAEWTADPRRILTEAAALRQAAAISPEAVPQVIDIDADAHAVVVSRAPATLRPWKQDLLAGRVETPVARRLGALLASWHLGTAHDPAAARNFGDQTTFVDLRIEPFYGAIARAHPDLSRRIARLADGLLADPVCLVHGDFSPKNVLTDGRAVWVLDWEVAHFGNPVFDVAFLLSHLLCKAVRRPDVDYRPLAAAFLAAYLSSGSPAVDARLLTAHTACLVLARVDGKSPVGYLGPAQRSAARALARTAIRTTPANPLDLWNLL